ncbi:MAG: c-type cytochrome biogenesis protein CcsB, partial [Candidatus Bipolaricaulia bacterium]
YLLGFFLYLFALIFRRARLGSVGTAVLAIGFLAQTLGLILRTIGMRMLSVTNTYEALVFYSWVFALAYLVIELLYRGIRQRLRPVGMFVALIAFAMIAAAASPLFSAEPRPLVPALQSYWLALHVSFTIVGEGFFAVAFFTSLLFLLSERRKRRGGDPLLSLELLDDISYKAVAIGFPFFTLGGLFFGAIWAKHAWGSYWSWDPKETFMLVTWLVYVLYLHLRVRYGWRERRAALIAVIGFILALFTFAGVNFLLRGLHSYT